MAQGFGTLKIAVSGMALLALLAGCERELILPGERFDVRTPLEASVAVEGESAPTDPAQAVENQSVPIALPAPVNNANWTHRGGNIRHNSQNGVLSAAPTRVWTANIGSGNTRKHRIATAPIVADGRVFTLDAAAGLRATSTAGGALWSADLTPATDRAGEGSGGGLGYGDGRLFVATGYGELVAVDPATGAIAWRQELGAPVTGAPSVDGGVVYVVGRDSSAWAVNAATGKVQWQLPGTPSVAGVVGSSGPAITDRAVLLPFANGDLVAALKLGGIKAWGTSIVGARLGRGYGNVSDITGDPVVAGEVTYVGNASGKTYAISTSSGEAIWMAPEGAMGPVVPVGGSVFLVNDEAQLVRLDAATGEKIWAVEMPYFTKDKAKKRKAIYPHFGPVLAGGRLVVAGGDGTLRLFSPTDGALVGSVDIPGGAATQPALAGGTLYVVSGKGQLHAFR